MSFLRVQVLAAGSYSITMPMDFQPGAKPPNT